MRLYVKCHVASKTSRSPTVPQNPRNSLFYFTPWKLQCRRTANGVELERARPGGVGLKWQCPCGRLVAGPFTRGPGFSRPTNYRASFSLFFSFSRSAKTAVRFVRAVA